MTQTTQWGPSPRVRHPGVWSQEILERVTMNKASGCDGIPAELFQVLKTMLWKCYTQYAGKFGKLSSGHRTGKVQFSFQSQRKEMPKKYSKYCTIALISHASKVVLKILQSRLQQYVNWELPDVQAGFRNAEEPEIKFQHPLGQRKSKRISEKRLLHWLS